MNDSVTISLLPVSLSIVHVPRARLHGLFHPLLRQLLLPNPTFLNITCNELELSLFAEHHVLRDFEPIARKDARRLKVRGRDRTTHATGDRTRRSHKNDWEPIEFSAERWNVLQIDSHSDGPDTSGARIHELSAPLAAAGISILYQSSYMSDFIFVKEHRLTEVMSLLASAGFDLYSSDPQNLTSQVSALASPTLSPLTGADDDNSSVHLLDLSAPVHSISSENGAVFTRSRSGTDPITMANSAHRSQLQPASLDTDDQLGESSADKSPGDLKNARQLGPRSLSHSPSGCDVRILEPDLTSIGLSDDTADMWTTKIIKLVAFPDMIPVPDAHRNRRSSRMDRQSPFDSDEPPPLDELDYITGMLGDSVRVLGTPDIESDSSDSRTDDTTRDGLHTPKDSDERSPSESPLFDLEHRKPWNDDECSSDEAEHDGGSSDDDSYFSPNLAVPDSPVRSLHEADIDSQPRRPSLPHLDTTPTTQNPVHVSPVLEARSRSASTSSTPESKKDPIVPFFSFTRTPEGSSLTASVFLLATLFPPSERHMVICSDELDILDSRVGSPEGFSDDTEKVDADEVSDGKLSGTLKCLQIDLRQFGLDKHGLVSRFSRALEDNGINHMYSSTYKTANLLVDKANAWRAQALLRSC